jgi:predicted nucleic acid-binding protein
VPGRSDSGSPWGELPLLIDTSAFSRATRPEIQEQWAQALMQDRFRICPPVRLEILLSAQNETIFDELAAELTQLRTASLTTTIVRAAEDAMRTLAGRSHGSHRLPIVDYLLAATAQDSGAAVLHYDRDYDTLAEVMGFESVWLAPAGSMP